MKYMRRFNESISDVVVDDVKYFLLELSDLGYKVNVTKSKTDDSSGKHKIHKKDELIIDINGFQHGDEVKSELLLNTIIYVLDYLKENKFKMVTLNDGFTDYTIDTLIKLLKVSKSKIYNLTLIARN